MTTFVLIAVAVLLLVLVAKAMRTLFEDSPRHQNIGPRLRPRIEGDSET